MLTTFIQNLDLTNIINTKDISTNFQHFYEFSCSVLKEAYHKLLNIFYQINGNDAYDFLNTIKLGNK
jgi:hypothetical protein